MSSSTFLWLCLDITRDFGLGFFYYLADRFNECVEDGQTAEEAFEFVSGVSYEHDWDDDPYDRWDVEPSRSDWDEVEPAWEVAM